MILLSSGKTFTFANARSRLSALSAIGWVTKMRGLAVTAATARYRQLRRRHTARHRESCAWHPALPAPSEFRARAQAKPGARWSLRARPRPRRRAVGSD